MNLILRLDWASTVQLSAVCVALGFLGAIITGMI